MSVNYRYSNDDGDMGCLLIIIILIVLFILVG